MGFGACDVRPSGCFGLRAFYKQKNNSGKKTLLHNTQETRTINVQKLFISSEQVVISKVRAL